MDSPLPLLYHKDGLAKDVVEIGKENPWDLTQGSMVRVVNGNFTQIARVVLLFGVPKEQGNHVTSSKWAGEVGIHGHLEILTPMRYHLLSIQQSPKLRIGLVCAVLTISSSYLTAALAKDGSFQPHLGGFRWALFGVTIAATLGAWLKDLWS